MLIHFILVNDGSTKNIDASIIEKIEQSVGHFSCISLLKNQGKGAAIRRGFEASKSPYIMYIDVDFPYTIENMMDMLFELKKGKDIVIGLRDKVYYAQIPMLRAILSKFFKILVKHLFNIPTSETQAGLKAFSSRAKSVVQETKINRYLFDLELVKIAHKRKLIFGFVPLTLNKGVVLSKLPLKVFYSELANLIRILFT